MKCACGEKDVDELGESGVWMHYAEQHTVARCEIEDWRTPWWRLCMWLSGVIDGLAGNGRSEPRVTVYEAPPSSPAPVAGAVSGQGGETPAQK